MRRRILIAVTLGGLLLLAVQTFSTPQQTDTRPALIGSWEFTVTPNPSPSTETPVTGLATFTSDFTVIETDTNASALHLTPGHGAWQMGPVVGHWFIRFTSLEATPFGTLRATRVTTMFVTLNSVGNEFNGSYFSEIIDAAGHAITSGSGNVKGQLIQLPLLP
jgi:hypothetical protein